MIMVANFTLKWHCIVSFVKAVSKVKNELKHSCEVTQNKTFSVLWRVWCVGQTRRLQPNTRDLHQTGVFALVAVVKGKYLITVELCSWTTVVS